MADKNECKDCVDSCTDGACTLGDKPDANGGGGAPGCLFGIVALVGVASLLCAIGCSTADNKQPAKSATMHNEIHDSVIIVAAKAKIPAKGSTNSVIEVDGANAPTIEILTQTQSLESSGTESYAPSATQTPTTDVKPDIDVKYNDAIAGATTASRGVLETLTAAGANKVLELMSSKSTGTVTVDRKDGTSATVKCEDGQCSLCTDCVDK